MQYIQIPPLFGMLFTAILVCFPNMPAGVYVFLGIICLIACIYLCRISYKWEKEWEAQQKTMKKGRSRRGEKTSPSLASSKSSAAKNKSVQTSSKSTKTATQSCRTNTKPKSKTTKSNNAAGDKAIKPTPRKTA